jgi:Cdc6-like AAA superfamily ATPase
MFQDAGVFDEDYLPRQLPHRDAERNELARAFQPVREGREADNVLIWGPSGVGKTTLVRHWLDKLEAKAEGVATAHLRCLRMTPCDVLETALDKHPTASADGAQSNVTDLKRALRDQIDQPYIVVLDEAHTMTRADVLVALDELPEISTVAICHDPVAWRARLDDSGDARIEDRSIQLDRYSPNELTDILGVRAGSGLDAGAYRTEQLHEIARNVDGRARRAIQTLKAAADLALRRDHHTIHTADVDDGYELAEQRILKQQLESMSYHHHVIYALIHETGELSSEELHARYDELADRIYRNRDQTPISRRARRNRLQDLIRYDLVEDDGINSGRQLTVADDTIAPPIDRAIATT